VQREQRMDKQCPRGDQRLHDQVSADTKGLFIGHATEMFETSYTVSMVVYQVWL